MLANFANEPKIDRVIVALDCPKDEALELGRKLAGKAKWVKVGMTLYYACGPTIVKEFKDLGFKVFVDLKLHDIPFQIEGAAYSAALSGADMLTMHTLGGSDMLESGQRGAEKAAAELGCDTAATLGITVLTSMNDENLAQIGIERAAAEQVKLLAGVAKASGISGIVCSPQEASEMRALLGPEAYIVTPGVRPAGSAAGDQSRIATPKQAFENGSSHIVVGRPITKAEDPVAAFDAIAEELAD